MRVEALSLEQRAAELPPFTPVSVGEVDGVVMALARGGASGQTPEWHVNDADELQVCLRGECTFVLRADGVDLPPVKASAGELVVIPAGVEHKVIAGEDCVAINVCRRTAAVRD